MVKRLSEASVEKLDEKKRVESFGEWQKIEEKFCQENVFDLEIKTFWTTKKGNTI